MQMMWLSSLAGDVYLRLVEILKFYAQAMFTVSSVINLTNIIQQFDYKNIVFRT